MFIYNYKKLVQDAVYFVFATDTWSKRTKVCVMNRLENKEKNETAAPTTLFLFFSFRADGNILITAAISDPQKIFGHLTPVEISGHQTTANLL